MRRSRVVGSCLGVLALTSACATSSGTMTSSRYDVTPVTGPNERSLTAAERDSVVAQSFADREGPRVSVRAEMSWVGGGRRIRAHFTLQDDAYVVVGHIDPDGVVRIMFPNDPKDDGFVRGDRSYTTNEAFAGFADEYRFRAQTARFYNSGYSPDAYDGGVGYVFVIASWRPMHFDRFSSGPESWDSFEIADDSYLRDPRPAIYELASLLSGENREAYTVQFAQYFSTTTLDGGSGFGLASSMYGASALCSGLGLFGFASSPFDNPIFSSLYPWGSSFGYRGSYYQYNYAGDCYTTGGFYNPYGRGYGYIATGPFVPNPRAGLISANDHRSPPTPRPVQPRLHMPGLNEPLQAESQHRRVAAADRDHFDPQYRNRGLITADDPTPGRAVGPRLEPRAGAHIDAGNTRPAIQQMLNRRVESQNEGRRDWSGARRMPSDAGTMRQGWARNEGGRTGASGQTMHAQPGDRGAAEGRYHAPADVQRTAPRMDSPRMAQPRSESPRSESPRFSAPAAAPARSAPPASRAPASSPPASSSSSSKPTP